MEWVMSVRERKIDDLCICFYGGEPLLKTRVIYKIMDMFPKAKFVFQVRVVAFCDVDERNSPEDGEGGLPPGVWTRFCVPWTVVRKPPITAVARVRTSASWRTWRTSRAWATTTTLLRA